MEEKENVEERKCFDGILRFIGKYSECKYEFLNGWCYAFASMLAGIFGGEIYYLPVQAHFVAKVDGKYYDVRGELSPDRLGEHPCRWKDYRRTEKTEAGRIMRDCIMREQ